MTRTEFCGELNSLGIASILAGYDLDEFTRLQDDTGNTYFIYTIPATGGRFFRMEIPKDGIFSPRIYFMDGATRDITGTVRGQLFGNTSAEDGPDYVLVVSAMLDGINWTAAVML